MSRIEDEEEETLDQKKKRIRDIIADIIADLRLDPLTIKDLMENFWENLPNTNAFLSISPANQRRRILNRINALQNNDELLLKDQLKEMLRTMSTASAANINQIVNQSYPSFIEFLYENGFTSIRQMLDRFLNDGALLRRYFKEFQGEKNENVKRKLADTEATKRKRQGDIPARTLIEQNLLEIFHTIESDAFFQWAAQTEGYHIAGLLDLSQQQLFNLYEYFCNDTGSKLPPRRLRGGKITPTVDNPDLYEKAKAIADAKYSKPSAYKSGFIVKTYKSLGGTYSGTKSKKLTKDIKKVRRKKGDGIMDVLNSGVNYVVDKGKQLVGSVVDTGKQVGDVFSKIITGSTDFSPSVRKILEAEGNNLIKSIVVGRTPVQSAITMALNAVSLGQFQKNQDALNYDSLFHLFSEITLADGKQVRVEKNEVITMTMGFKQDPDTERQEVPMTKSISFRDLLENARRKMKQKFFAYDSANNNCQDFIMALIQASGLGSQENFDFIKQNTKQLFEKIPRTRALAKQITNLGQRINIARSGGKISSNSIMPKFAKGSQEARDHMARIRGMRGGATGKDLGKNLAGNLGRLADSGTNKLINMMGTGRNCDSDDEMTGGKVGANLGSNLAGNLGRLADSGTNKLINMMGTGLPEEIARAQSRISGISGKGVTEYIIAEQLARKMMGGGHHIHHHHYHPNSYMDGGNLGYGAGHSAEYGSHSGGNLSYSNTGLSGRGFAEDLIGKLGIKMPTNATEAVQQAQILQGLTPQGIAISQVKKMMGRGGPKGLASFTKWTKAIGDFLAPVAKPILQAGTQQAVNNINAYGNAYANRAY